MKLMWWAWKDENYMGLSCVCGCFDALFLKNRVVYG